jgi:hypothetical protein
MPTYQFMLPNGRTEALEKQFDERSQLFQKQEPVSMSA